MLQCIKLAYISKPILRMVSLIILVSQKSVDALAHIFIEIISKQIFYRFIFPKTGFHSNTMNGPINFFEFPYFEAPLICSPIFSYTNCKFEF